MQLIVMFDSPYVRRVAVSLMHLEIPFDHANWSVGAGEKARDQLYVRMVRPPERFREPWVARCREQMHGAPGLLEAECRARGSAAWFAAAMKS